MRKHISNRRAARTPVLVPMDRVKEYFDTPGWELDFSTENGVDKLIATSEEFDIKVEIDKGPTKFKVEAESVDDPTDRLDVVTTDPIKELHNFLSAGLPEGAFESYASNPVLFSKIIRRAASKIKQLGPKRTANFIKQAIAILEFESFRTILASIIKIAEGEYGELEIVNLLKKMEAKGWDVKEETRDGRAALKINFHDLWDITIYPSSITYDFDFIIEGYPESAYWGSDTDDPIRDFQNWFKEDRFVKAIEERNDAIDAAELDADKYDASDVLETVKPGAGATTVKPGAKSEEGPPKSVSTPEAFADTEYESLRNPKKKD